MQLAKILVALAFTAGLLATPALAQPPVEGTWTSTDMGGDVLTGRYTEAFDQPEGAASIGTVLNAQSWDGASLGTQWSYSCGVIVGEPVLLSDTVSPSGTGSRTYEKHFVGGTIWLSGSGPWAGGAADYSGPILSYVEYETIQYVNFERTHAVTNVAAIAQIDGYSESCLSFTVGNGVEIGSTDFGQMLPADYPPTLDATSCAPNSTNSAWWDIFTISLYIDSCTVPNEDQSWGAVKSMYR